MTFPTDDVTLALLEAACHMNPDSGHTELHAFLDMGSQVKSRTLVSDPDDPGIPVYDVEFEEGREPYSPQQVILALIDEVRRLRGRLEGDPGAYPQ